MYVCIVAGDREVGKTEFIKTLCENSDQPRVAANDVLYSQTIISRLRIEDDGSHTLEKVKFAFTEVHGTDELLRIRKLTSCKADFAIVMCDASNEKSWRVLDSITEILEFAHRVMVVVNKSDKLQAPLDVHNLPQYITSRPWIEVSCATHQNVFTPLHMLLDLK